LDISDLYRLFLASLSDLTQRATQWPDGYFVIAAVGILALALALRSPLAIAWALLSAWAVLALVAQPESMRLVLIGVTAASALLILLMRWSDRRRQRALVRQVGELQRRVGALESASERQFLQGLRNGSQRGQPSHHDVVEEEGAKS
jgi:hypothetical protein